MKKMKKVIAGGLVAAVLVTAVQVLPVHTVNAVETISAEWNITKSKIKNLDQICFYKTDEKTEKIKYIYGYANGKVTITDWNYKIIKQTEYTHIESTKINKMGEGFGFIVSKKNGDSKMCAVLSETGETILEGGYRIAVLAKDEDNIIYADAINDNTTDIYLNSKKIYTSVNEIDDIEADLSKRYNGEKYIELKDMILNKDDSSYNKKYFLFSYEGEQIKELTEDEYEDYMYGEKAIAEKYKKTCNEWLDKAAEEGKEYVKSFYEGKKIDLTDIEVRTSIADPFKKDMYWVLVGAKYSDPETNKEYECLYSFLYDESGNIVVSGRTFGTITNMLAYYYHMPVTYISENNGVFLQDNGQLVYYNYGKDEVENLYKVDESSMPYLFCGGPSDDDENADLDHILTLEDGIYVYDESRDKKTVYSTRERKMYEYDARKSGFLFKQNQDQLEIFLIDNSISKYNDITMKLDDLKEAKVEFSNQKILFINQLDDLDDNDNKANEKIWLLTKNQKYEFPYKDFGDDIKHIYFEQQYDHYVVLRGAMEGDKQAFFYIDMQKGSLNRLSCSARDAEWLTNRCYLTKEKTIDGKIYFAGRSPRKSSEEEDDWDEAYGYAVYFDVKNLKLEIVTPAVKISVEEEMKQIIEDIYVIGNRVYMEYYDYNEESNKDYGIIDPEGKKHSGMKSHWDEFYPVGDYLYVYKEDEDVSYSDGWRMSENGKLYDQNMSEVSENIVFMKQEDDPWFEVIRSSDKNSTIKPVIYHPQTKDKIYEMENTEVLVSGREEGKYYILNIKPENDVAYNVLLDAETNEVLYKGSGYVYVDEKNRDVIIFTVQNEKEPEETKKPEPSAAPIPTATVQPENPDAEPTSTAGTIKKENVKKGDKVTVAGAKYTVASSNEVCYVAAKKSTASVVIPATVKINGTTLKVTSVAANAFKSNKTLKSITIGKNVNKIGNRAFSNCKKLKTIVIKSTKLKASKISKKAFKGIAGSITIKVPKSKLKTYKKLLRSKGLAKSVRIKIDK